MIYILVWIFCFLMLGCLVRWPHHGKAFSILAVLAMGALAVFRGAVGTDTQAYEMMSALVRQSGVIASGVEPVFGLLLQVPQLLGLSDIGGVRLIAALDVVLLMVYVWRSTEDDRYFLLALLLPAFFYAYAMNALRIGLASLIFLLVGQQIAQRGKPRPNGWLLLCLSVLLHYSSAIFPLFFLSVFRRWSRFLVLSGLGLCVGAGLAIMVISPDYIMTRLQSYDGFAAPSRLSGLSSLIQIFIMALAVWKSDLPAELKTRLIAVPVALTAVFIGVTQFSYAGLRLLDLVVFVCPVAVYCAHGMQGLKMNAQVRSLMLVFGIVTAAFVFRRFLNEPAGGPSPFLPYHFLF